MRILYIVHQFFPEFASGTERVTLSLARMAQRAGHRVQVLSCVLDPTRLPDARPGPVPGSLEASVESVPVLYLGRDQLPLHAESSFEVTAGLRGDLASWMQARGFDVVHLMHSMRMGTAIAAVQQAQLPLVVSLTDFHPMCLRTNLMDAAGQACDGPQQGAACVRRCPVPHWTQTALAAREAQAAGWLRYASARLAPSAFVARRFESVFPNLAVHVIPHGVDGLAVLQTPGTRPALAEGLRLLFVGSLIEIKGLQGVLQALASQPDLKLRLDVAGGFHGDPVFQAALRRQIAADARVVLHGQLPPEGVRALMTQAHAMVLPSLVPESFSLSLHEGFAMGLPALVSDLGAPAEAVARTGAGRVLPAGDVAAWAAAITDWAQHPNHLESCAARIEPPLRIEEEAFLTESLYWGALGGA